MKLSPGAFPVLYQTMDMFPEWAFDTEDVEDYVLAIFDRKKKRNKIGSQ